MIQKKSGKKVRFTKQMTHMFVDPIIQRHTKVLQPYCHKKFNIAPIFERTKHYITHFIKDNNTLATFPVP